MVYCTTKQVSDLSGLGLRVKDENVGTGDASETDFDLDNDNIIATSYTLSHAASGSNTFTDLTETTHYTLDKESGRIVLTGTGVTEVGTDVIYATYTYTKNFSDAYITNIITFAQSEVDKMLGRSYDTISSVTEYHDGRRTRLYPTTDNPYSADWDAPDYLMLDKYPVTQINAVYFLENPINIAQFFNYDTGTAAYTDYTDYVNDLSEGGFTLFDAVPVTGDIVYIGSETKFLGVDTVLSTLGTGSPAIDWEYYNGSSWADITETDTDTGASTFEASGKFTFSIPSSWEKVSVNSSESLYYIRGKVATGYTIAPICLSMAIKDSISQILHNRDWAFETFGKLTLLNNVFFDGTKNIRVDYKYGSASVPALIQEMTSLLAGISLFLYQTGNSYDAATAYTLGSKQISIGEQYVNIREVLNQFKNRINEIRSLLGGRGYVASI